MTLSESISHKHIHASKQPMKIVTPLTPTDPALYHSPSPPVPPLAGHGPRNLPPNPVIPMTTKVCVKCKQEKPLLEFHKNSRSSDGLHSYCKECNRAQALAHIRAEKARKALLRAAKKAAAANH